jgi:lipopolysaccharide/colanic/teichoic acid biosynthesis glycosyltransferase
MRKRLLDFVLALAATLLTLPIVAICALLVWAQDGRSPFYSGLRVGRRGRDFQMVKLRTMIAGADGAGGLSTAASDSRLTPLGAMLRRWKIDELPQFWNVLKGDMSIVGPRPNFRVGGIDRYTGEELKLLSVRPGITDVASIVFSDEGEILDGSGDPDGLYDAIIRPWKNRLALLYVERRTTAVDLQLIALTLVALVSKDAALRGVDHILESWGASAELRRICARSGPLPAGEPPGEFACR